MDLELQNKVLVPATLVSMGPTGKFSLSIKGFDYLLELNREDFYKREDLSFETLMKKNGELQNTISSLKDEISRLEDRLNVFDHLIQLFKEVME